MKQIPLSILTLTVYALVDDEDYEKVKNYNWQVNFYGGTSGGTFSVSCMTHRRMFLHRFLTNCPKDMVVDHINGNGLDNRRENLRVCTRKENSQNTKKRLNTSSKYKGVSWHNRDKNWSASICINSKLKFLGNFALEIDAAKAYNEAAKQHFGEFAKLNDIK